MKIVFAFVAGIVAALASMAFAVERESSALCDTIEFQGKTWKHNPDNRVAVEEYRGNAALHLYGGDKPAYLSGVKFREGALEVDLARTDRKPPGIGFRGRDNGNWRNVILFNLRKAEHQDTREFVEQGVGTRRNGTVLLLNIRTPDPCKWLHVKATVQGRKVAVYLNGNAKPSIEVDGMFDEDEEGVVGLYGQGCFANFRYTID